MKKNEYPHAGGIFAACFNSHKSDARKAFKKVREKFGEEGVKKIKKINKTGLMAMFRVKQTPETLLFAKTIADSVEERWAKEDQWFFKPVEE